MSFDPENSLRKWAEQVLEGIGISKDRIPNFEELQQKVIQNLKETYSGEVINHFLNPRNLGSPSDHDGFAKVTGSCGDSMEIYLRVKDGRIASAAFQTDGCIASIASGSMVTTMIRGKTIAEAQQISSDDILQALGSLPQESVHCAVLAADTLKEALKDYLKRHQLLEPDEGLLSNIRP